MQSPPRIHASRQLARARKKLKATETFPQNFFTTPHQSFLDTNGEPLAGGMLYVYEAGTTTMTDTWQDSALTQVNTNPVILDSGGFCTVWLDPTLSYKFRMCNAFGVQQWTVDDYQGGSLTANILVPINYLLPATGPNDINNSNYEQVWRWQLTGANTTYGLAISETPASTNTDPHTSLLAAGTLSGSTINPFEALAQVSNPGTGVGLRVLPNGDVSSIGGANIFTNIQGIANQCVQADINGRLFGTGLPCGSGGAGIASINTDTTPAQQIIGTGAAVVNTVGGVTTIYVPTGTTTTPVLGSITMSPASVVGGGNSTGTVTLTAPAPAGGAIVTLTSSNTSVASVPASVTVAANATVATFTVTTSSVSTSTPVTISGNYGATQSATLTVAAPAQIILSSITISPNSQIGGQPATGTAALSGPAPAGGAVVTLSSANTAAAQVPASVTVPASATSANFTVTTSPVSDDTSVVISGTYVSTHTGSLTVTPVAQPIYGGYAPANDSTGVEFDIDGNLVLIPYTGDMLPVLQNSAEQVGQSWQFSPATQCICLVLFGGSHTFVDQNNNTLPFVSPPVTVTVNGTTMYLYSTLFQLATPFTVKVAS